MPTVVLKPGLAKPLWMGHPWVYADSVASVEPDETDAGTADWVRVTDAKGKVIGCGFHSPGSAIRVRLLTGGDTTQDPDAILAERIRSAVDLRRRLFSDPQQTNAYRLVHAEGDGLPGLVVDRLDDVLVAQFATGPVHRRRAALAELLLEETGALSLVARPGGFEAAEGIEPDAAPYSCGGGVPEQVAIREGGLWLCARPLVGQKTGHYADQRENRLLVGQVAAGLRVLDLHAGTGGFSLQALRQGAAHALAVDISRQSLAAAEEAAKRNGVSERLDLECRDVTEVLHELRAKNERFGLVVVDPPNFFPRKGPGGHALKGYRELNVRALSRVDPGGFLATFTCSAKLGPKAFLSLLRAAARECRRDFSILRELTAGPDHPVAQGLGSGRYLSGLLLRVNR